MNYKKKHVDSFKTTTLAKERFTRQLIMILIHFKIFLGIFFLFWMYIELIVLVGEHLESSDNDLEPGGSYA